MRIKDVADRAGVSPATVSRVLNIVASVGPEYRDRVLKATGEVGYRPNRLASNLRRQKAEIIGVVVSDIENPHFTQMVRAVEDAAFRKGYRVLLCNTDEAPQKAYLEMLAAERVMGVMISPSNPSGQEISDLIDLGIPVIAFDRTVEDPRADAVAADNAAGVWLATEYLIGAGHERIGFVSGLEGVETSAQRRFGYERAMREVGLEPRSAVGGSGSLAQPVREIAACAVELLMERLDGRRNRPRRVVFDFQLRIRGSCGTAVSTKGGG